MAHDPDRSARIREIFLEALELPSPQRSEFVASQCAGDPGLAAEVESLLSFAVDHSAQAGLATGAVATQIMRRPAGDRVADFTIQRPLGSGASGDVYLAIQDSPRRDVALKLLRATGDPEAHARFQLEGAALARLSHEGIARVYAVGEDSGRLYMALELVTGQPISAYADVRRLTVAERVALFITLCDALEHIHQNGLIHRDLKPNNVVVSEGAVGPVPKVIDFGIAKALGGAAGPGGRTLDGAILGTIEYASPEQLNDSRSVDTRSDIYSAGVMLYELLVGTRPHRLGDRGLGAFVAAVQRDDPPLPSASLIGDAPTAATAAALRQTTPERLLQELRTDLDWIAAKALRKSAAERYATAGELRADLQRYLRNEPVLAHPPTLRYRLGKELGRRRGAAIATAAIVIAIVAGMTATLHQSDIATARLRELEQLSTDLVASVNEIADRPGAIEAKRRLVASATKTLESIAVRSSSPAMSARLADAYERVGQLRADPYAASLGEMDEGIRDLSRAAEIRRKLHEASPDMDNAVLLMQSLFTLAIAAQSGYPMDVDSLVRAAIRIGAPIVERDTTALEAMRILSMLYDLHAEYEMGIGQWGSTLWCIDRAYELRRAMARQDGGKPETIRLIAESHGRLAYAATDPRVSRRHGLATLAIMKEQFDRDPFSYRAHLDLSYAYRNAAYSLRRCGAADSALGLLRRVIPLRRAMALADARDLRSRHQLALAYTWLAEGLVAVGQMDSAVVYAQMAIEMGDSAAASPAAPRWATDVLRLERRTYARVLRHARRFAAADSLFDLICAEPILGNATDAVRGWREWVERAQFRRAAGDLRGADSAFACSEPYLQWAAGFISAFTRDAAPFADLALGYVHLAQVADRDPDRRVKLLESGLALPHFEADERHVRPLLQNELACALADRQRGKEARRLLRDALGRPASAEVRDALRANLRSLDARGTRFRTAPYDPSRDPYANLDLTVFRMVTVWAEHPVPPPSRRVPVGDYESASRRRSQASASRVSPRTVRSETSRAPAVSGAVSPRT